MLENKNITLNKKLQKTELDNSRLVNEIVSSDFDDSNDFDEFENQNHTDNDNITILFCLKQSVVRGTPIKNIHGVLSDAKKYGCSKLRIYIVNLQLNNIVSALKIIPGKNFCLAFDGITRKNQHYNHIALSFSDKKKNQHLKLAYLSSKMEKGETDIEEQYNTRRLSTRPKKKRKRT